MSELFHIVHHTIELFFSTLIVYGTFFAIKKFRLIIWKRGWHFIGLGAFLFIFVESFELLESLGIIRENVLVVNTVHVIHAIAFPLIGIGVYFLSKTAQVIYGK